MFQLKVDSGSKDQLQFYNFCCKTRVSLLGRVAGSDCKIPWRNWDIQETWFQTGCWKVDREMRSQEKGK